MSHLATTKNIITNNTQKDNMPFIKTEMDGLLIFEPNVFEDERGFFYESFNKKHFLQENIDIEFVQDNQAFSSYGVVRGLHFQKGSAAQAKLVSVLQGSVIDVVVDLRNDSTTFGKVYSIQLDAATKKQLFIPRGFAHGYSVVSETALFYYKCDNYYNKEMEGGINLLYSNLLIDWQVDLSKMIVSDKDKSLSNFNAQTVYF